MKIKISAMILCILMLVLFVVSCTLNKKPDEPNESQTTTALQETEDSNYDSNGFIKDTLENINYNGDDVSILYWQDVENLEYFMESPSGNNVDNAIYSRNVTVEQRLNVKLKYIPTLGNSANARAFTTFVETENKAGTNSYEIISAHSRSIGLTAVNGLTVNLRDIDNINFTMPWWQESLLTEATINDKLYFASGDISTNMLYMMYCTFYNKSILAEEGLEDPYELAINGKWTLDEMLSMSENLYSDKNGNNIKDYGDKFGQMAYELHIDAFLWGSGIVGIEKDENGDLSFAKDIQGEKGLDLVVMLCNYFNKSKGTIIDKANYKKAFVDGNSLFITDRADIAITDMDGKEFEIGILPIAKFDERQEDYKTLLGNPFSLYAIPVFAKNPDRAGAVLECLASESYRNVTPQIFEVTMKVRYSANEQSATVYDIIRDGAVYDLTRIFFKSFTTPLDSIYQNSIKTNDANWISTINKYKSKYNSEIALIQEAFGK